MSLLEIKGLNHRYGDQVLYRDEKLAINRGEHLGVVGPNGAGKSTLIKIISGEVIPDGGDYRWQPGISYGCLDQGATVDPALGMNEFLATAFQDLYALEERMLAYYEAGAQGDEAALTKAARLQERLEVAGFYEVETKIDQVVTGLGLAGLGGDHPIGEMSGGQRAKVILAKLLLQQPEVLLLDEPTNFLDPGQVTWLADYLRQLDQAYLVVSHDYEFLDAIAGGIVDVDGGHIAKYTGSYSEFLRKKTLLRQDYLNRYAAEQKKIAETEAFIRKNIAGRKTKMAQGRRKQLARMERLERPDLREPRASFHFPVLPLTETEHLTVSGLAVGYHYPLLKGLDLSLRGGQKIALTGFNGIGKSTLLKTLMGELVPLAGRFSFSEQVTAGYFEQELHWDEGSLSPLTIIQNAASRFSGKEVRRHLDRCGIPREHATQSVATLSGGEQGKVKLALLTLKASNFLILDEPTNHLDARAKEALREAITEYPGTVLLVSHEEAFYRELVDRVVDIGKISH